MIPAFGLLGPFFDCSTGFSPAVVIGQRACDKRYPKASEERRRTRAGRRVGLRVVWAGAMRSWWLNGPASGTYLNWSNSLLKHFYLLQFVFRDAALWCTLGDERSRRFYPPFAGPQATGSAREAWTTLRNPAQLEIHQEHYEKTRRYLLIHGTRLSGWSTWGRKC